MTDALEAAKPPVKRPPLPKGRIEVQGERKMSDLARFAIDWMQKIIIVDDAGTRFKVARYQEDVLRDIYATRGNGDRLCNRYILSIGRKQGKTTLGACIQLFEASSKIAPRGAWMYTAAAGSEKQARIVFNMMMRMVERQPLLKSRFQLSPAAGKMTNLRRLNTIEALSKNAKSAHGREAYAFTFDELAQAKDGDLLDALDKSGRKVSNGTGLIISTNSTAPGNPMLELIDTVRLAHARGQLQEWNYRVYAPDLKLVDWMSDEALFIANPGLYEDPPLVEWQLYENDRVKAMASPREKNNYIAYRLNASSGVESALVDPVTWKDFAMQPDEVEDARVDHAGKKCVIGIDLSKTTDMSAIVALFPEDGYVRSCAWLPADRVDELEVLDKAPYRAWVDDGWLRLCNGATVDYDDLAEYLVGLMSDYDVQEVRYDPYMFKIFEHSLKKHGLHIDSESFKEQFVAFKQTFAWWTPAIAALEQRIEEKQIVHEADPLLASAIVGMKIKDSNNTSSDARAPEKGNRSHRIDAAVALLMAALPIEVEEERGDAVPSSRFLDMMRNRPVA